MLSVCTCQCVVDFNSVKCMSGCLNDNHCLFFSNVDDDEGTKLEDSLEKNSHIGCVGSFFLSAKETKPYAKKSCLSSQPEHQLDTVCISVKSR